MPLFICDKCDTIENTALGRFWGVKYKGGDALCSACMPELRYRDYAKGGKWHGRFKRKKATLESLKKEDLSNFIYLGRFEKELNQGDK
jgi:hypothetical protein